MGDYSGRRLDKRREEVKVEDCGKSENGKEEGKEGSK